LGTLQNKYFPKIGDLGLKKAWVFRF
jgi:hypothetical protein